MSNKTIHDIHFITPKRKETASHEVFVSTGQLRFTTKGARIHDIANKFRVRIAVDKNKDYYLQFVGEDSNGFKISSYKHKTNPYFVVSNMATKEIPSGAYNLVEKVINRPTAPAVHLFKLEKVQEKKAVIEDITDLVAGD